MKTGTLFKNFNPIPEEATKETCRSCKHRERHQCGNSIIQYCGILNSNRTQNKQLKVKCIYPACEHWKGIDNGR